MRNTHHTIDVHIGKRAHQRRRELKLSLEKLSLYSGISIADLHRIEEGKARVSALQVFNLSHALHISTAFFFETCRDFKNDEIDRLITAYIHINNHPIRAKLLRLIEANADMPSIN